MTLSSSIKILIAILTTSTSLLILRASPDTLTVELSASFDAHIWEVHKVYQNIGFKATNAPKGEFTITNKRYFKSLNDLDFQWFVEANGHKIADGSFALKTQAQASDAIKLPLNKITTKPGVEYHLTIKALSKTSTDLVDAGHTIAWEQIRLTHLESPATPTVSTEAMGVVENDSSIMVSGSNFVLSFNKQTGSLTNLNYNGTEYLKSAPRPDFWRAPTDNDFGEGFQKKAAVWQNAGKERTLTSIQSSTQKKGSVVVSTEHALPSIESRYFTTYTIEANGVITVDCSFYAAAHKQQSELPRFGTLFELDKALTQVNWFGRGPHENYIDRSESAPVGSYSATVSELKFDYIRPQENGYRTEVRQLALRNPETGEGLQFQGMPHLSFNASTQDKDTMDSSKNQQLHPYQIPESDRLYLNIDYRQRGVGGTNSWGAAPLHKNTLPWIDYHYSFKIAPFQKN